MQLVDSSFEEAADIARGLPDALLVLDKRNPDELVAVFAEPDPRVGSPGTELEFAL